MSQRPPAPPSPRAPARHVQAAVQVVQRKAGFQPPPAAPHVQRATAPPVRPPASSPGIQARPAPSAVRPPAPHVQAAFQRTVQAKPAPPAAPARNVVQRIALNLDPGDDAIDKSAKVEKQRQERALGRTVELFLGRGMPSSQPLLHLNPDEPITILAHGEPAFGGQPPKVAGKSPQELYTYLVLLGLTTAHRGVINLSNCTTAWSRRDEGSFAEAFLGILRRNGYTNQVTGFRSFVSSESVSVEREVDPARREQALAMFMADRYIHLMNDYDFPGNSGSKGLLRRKAEEGARILNEEARRLLLAGDMTFVAFYSELAALLVDFSVTRDNGRADFGMTFGMQILNLKKKHGLYNLDLARVPASQVSFGAPVPPPPVQPVRSFLDDYDPTIEDSYRRVDRIEAFLGEITPTAARPQRPRPRCIVL